MGGLRALDYITDHTEHPEEKTDSFIQHQWVLYPNGTVVVVHVTWVHNLVKGVTRDSTDTETLSAFAALNKLRISDPAAKLLAGTAVEKADEAGEEEDALGWLLEAEKPSDRGERKSPASAAESTSDWLRRVRPVPAAASSLSSRVAGADRDDRRGRGRGHVRGPGEEGREAREA